MECCHDFLDFILLLSLKPHISRVLLLHQLCKRQLFCQIFNCWFLNIYFFYKIFFFRLKPKQYKNASIADCLKNIWKLIKQNKLTVELFDEKPSYNWLTRDWCPKFATGLNNKIGIIQKVCKRSSCPFDKTIPKFENHFGKRTNWSPLHSLNYVYFGMYLAQLQILGMSL